MIFWLFGLLLALVVAIFASHNPMLMDISFFGLVIYRVSLSVVILVSAFLGALVSFFFSGIKQLGMGREIRKTKKALDETSQRELKHLEEIKVLQLAKEQAMIEAERNATGDIRQFRDELKEKELEIARLRQQLETSPAETPAQPEEEQSKPGVQTPDAVASDPETPEQADGEDPSEKKD